MFRSILTIFLMWAALRVVRYLVRRFRVQMPNPGRARGASPMDESQALEVLGLNDSASRDQILEAHMRLAKKMHPDQGGSNYLAAEINRARDVLLRRD